MPRQRLVTAVVGRGTDMTSLSRHAAARESSSWPQNRFGPLTPDPLSRKGIGGLGRAQCMAYSKASGVTVGRTSRTKS
jgi:hypothetical protein